MVTSQPYGGMAQRSVQLSFLYGLDSSGADAPFLSCNLGLFSISQLAAFLFCCLLASINIFSLQATLYPVVFIKTIIHHSRKLKHYLSIIKNPAYKEDINDKLKTYLKCTLQVHIALRASDILSVPKFTSNLYCIFFRFRFAVYLSRH